MARGGRRRGRVVAGAVALVVLVAAVLAWRPWSAPLPTVPVEELRVDVGPEPDGEPVALDASVHTPPPGTPGADADGRRAAVLLAHGFGGSEADLAGQARDLARDGYVVLTWSARGFGESGGRIHLVSPDFEVADVSRLLDLLAARDDVRLDAGGDPVVGVAGASYGGATALLAAAYDDRVDAVVPAITWHDLDEAFFPQAATGAPDAAPPGVFKQRWASLFFASGLRPAAGDAASPAGPCGRFDPQVCALYTRAATTGEVAPAGRALLRRSSVAPVVERVGAPTLLVQGQQDSLFGLDQADATARALAAAGTEVAVRWVDGGHDAGAAPAADDLLDPALAWFDHHLRGGPDPGDDFELTLPASPFGEDRPERLVAEDYAAEVPRSLPLTGPPQPVLAPPGGEPAAVTSLPGTGPLLGATTLVGGAAQALGVLPGQSAVFTTPPVTEPLTVAGAPQVGLRITSTASDATLFAAAWVVAADGTTTLPRALVAPLRLSGLTPGEPREVTVALPASAYRLETGQRLQVVVSSTDAAYALPTDARTYEVALAGDATLTLPVVDAERAGGGPDVSPVLLGAVAAALAGALALALVTALRRRRDEPVDPDLAEVPLAVDGLVKSYRNGFRAVDGVTWRAERGQVVGLLGPNGAGKTTTMRMLVGLVRSDAGTVHVLGRRVAPGAPVLARVGALIEGPGALPHLTGRQNLEAAWAATGRPRDEADLEEVLAIAALGAAADKPVRSYSQGMRQRLGIAQAMLGTPELLLLDEPLNGLDPPQIRALRDVLRDYAAGGRTVVVSSHLLSEVQQTCSHVVVVHRGRVVLDGAVDDLLAGHRQLEEVFMELVGDGGPAQLEDAPAAGRHR
ncbi:alpha/beta fold hydrolase [Nocardioides perillae]|uniref:ABC-2 type transport system ATP-binding protein n=1 Tax=Nocardioides perillae TaxID=1119534 RepID=A0A7Y9RPD9_9ACTN|nr:alpha/beta fold hydrolase [Nocardioides perillae]NYG53890.1 ABC-2 type transport system ATP-binding protein [Nocardioides perillae]